MLAKLFLIPTFVYIIGLVAFPFILAILFSFSDVTTGNPSLDFVGLAQWRAILDSKVFWTSFWNTLTFTIISMTFVVLIANVLARVLIKDFKGKWLVRFCVLLPWTTPISLASVSWLWLLHSIFSPIDWVLRWVGLIEENMYWLGRPVLAMGSIIAVNVWRIVPVATVIVMAGHMAIPDDIKDAAEIDGARPWRTFREITLPLTLPITAVAALFGSILTFADMTIVFILTRGGPTQATQTLSSWAYFKGIEGGDLAQGAAVALFLFPLLLAAAIAILRVVKRAEVM
ncbi:MAG: ABC transporter permease subunit [Actinobacteria bacterium]|jgi:multiple sugar transport system permease protein|nr:ABC transporter permease subunit [Actinomycetota bacterium]